MLLRSAIMLVLLAVGTVGYAATTYEVGPGKAFTTLAGLPGLAPGDVVQISAGTYNEVKRWTNSGTVGNPITIRGVGAARSVIDGAGKNVDGAMPNPRAVFQIEASHIVIEHLEFINATNGNNGAGLRVTGSGLTGVIIRDCRIRNNDMGMMGDSFTDALIENCEIDNNGVLAFSGFCHNVYTLGGSITFRGCYIHDPLYGQNVKSRAHFTALLYNYIADSQDGEVGLVDSADTSTANSNAVMIGNIVISKDRGVAWNNSKFIAFGDDGGGAHSGTLYAFNNTFIAGATTNIFLFSTRADASIVASNNVCIGSARISNGSVGSVTGTNNWLPTGATVPGGFTGSVLGSAPGFVTPNSDLHLVSGATARDIGSALSTYLDGSGTSQSGVPAFTYEGLGNLVARASDGSLDAGAYEYIAPGGTPELDVTRSGAVADGSTDSVSGATAGSATSLTYTLTNSGTASLTVSGATTFASASNCSVSITTQPNSSIAASGSTSLVVSVTPTAAGAWSFTLSTPNSDGDENPYDWTVSGSATVAPTPELDVTRSGVVSDGGTDTVTGTTAGLATNLSYTLTNNGTASLTVSGATTFASASNCSVSIITQPNSSIAASGSTLLVVSVTPTTAGAWSLTLSTPNSDSDENPYDWTVSGSATAAPTPELDVTCASVAVVDGGTDTVTGSTAGIATNRTYVLTNSGSASLSVTAATTFASTSNCSVSIITQPASSVAASGTTSLVVSVTPTAVGAWSFTLSTSNTDSNEDPYTWTIFGNATSSPAPELDVARSSVAVANGSSDNVTGSIVGVSTNVTYVFANNGTATLSITAASIVTGATNCTVVITTQPAASVATSASTTLVVSVTPSAAGAWSFTLSTANTDSDENPYSWLVTSSAASGTGGTTSAGKDCGLGSGLALMLGLLSCGFLGRGRFDRRTHRHHR